MRKILSHQQKGDGIFSLLLATVLPAVVSACEIDFIKVNYTERGMYIEHVKVGCMKISPHWGAKWGAQVGCIIHNT